MKYRELKDILIIKNGKDYKNLTEGKYPVYGSGGIMTYVSSYVYDKPSVLIPRKGSIDKIILCGRTILECGYNILYRN